MLPGRARELTEHDRLRSPFANGSTADHSAAMAASTSSRAARRAGQLAASRPSSAARTRKTTRFETGTTVSVMPCECSDDDEGDAEARPDDDADDRAEDGEDHRLGADHGPDLAALHADRPQQPDLVGALEHRQHERVHDPDEGDDHGQGEQRVDQAEQLVDLGRL